MNPVIHFKSLRRTIIVALVVVSLAASVAFALLQNRGLLTGNTISTASANLLLSTDGVNYSQTVPGFDFANMVPGGYPAPADGYPVYLKNTGTTSLDLKLVFNGIPSNPGAADFNKINLTLTDVSGNTGPKGFILASLFNEGQPIEGELAPGATRQYKLQALAANDATTGVTIGNINLAFVGTAQDPNDPNQ